MVARGPVEGTNCLLQCNGHGEYAVRVIEVAYGVEIISSESEARNTRAMYPLTSNEPSFTLSMAFVDTEERDAFNDWIREYWDRVSANDATIGGFMSVNIGIRNFFRQGVPANSLVYGARYDEVTISAYLRFVGTVNPIDGVGTGNLDKVGSFFKKPTVDLQNGLFYYPSAIQVQGSAGAEGTLYNGTGVVTTGYLPISADVHNPAPVVNTGPGRNQPSIN